MRKAYSTPELIAKGTVVELTLGPITGVEDGDNTQPFPFGSIGFGL